MRYRYDHLHLLGSDLETTGKFLQDVLGATLVERCKFGEADGLVLDLQGTKICCRVAAPGEEVRGDSAELRYGYHHLGLAVEDVEAAYLELRQKGVVFTRPPTKGERGWVAFFKGPDNIIFELYRPTEK